MEEKVEITPVTDSQTSNKKLNIWKAISAILFSLLLASLLLFFTNQDKESSTSSESKKTVKEARQGTNQEAKKEFTLSFGVAGTEIDDPVSKYEHMLLSSPSVTSEQKTKSWKYLNCLIPSEKRNFYKFDDVKRNINDKLLIDGLQTIEDFEYTSTIVTQGNDTIETHESRRDIDYVSICKNDNNYYVLFTTFSDKTGQSHSNLATINKEGEANIFENITGLSKTISIDDLSEGGFSDPASRDFAYYACRHLIGILENDLYLTCGGSGASGAFKVVIEPFSITEMSFCWWLPNATERACYDKSGNIYYRDRQ